MLSPRELHDELLEIRRLGWTRVRKGSAITCSAAFPDGESGWAAIGCLGPDADWSPGHERAIREAAAAAGQREPS